MLTATTEMAIRALVYIAVKDGSANAPVRAHTPREISEAIGASSTYLAKTLNTLVKAGILRSARGALGGVVLATPPENITLLAIMQACQGLVTADYCDALGNATSPNVCAFHQAMFELHEATLQTLRKWNLKMLASKPAPTGKLQDNRACKLIGCGCKTK